MGHKLLTPDSRLIMPADRFRRRDIHQSPMSPSGRMDSSVSPMAIKRVDLGENGKFSGYLSVFGNEDFYGEVVAPGAWKESIADWKSSGQMVPLLWQHMSFEPIGVWTLFEEDKIGLRGEAQILVDAGPTEARAWAHVKAGSITGLSPGYYLEEWQADDEGNFTILKADLREGSVVTFPANREAQIDEQKAGTLEIRRRVARGEPLTVRQMELLLREHAGLSRSNAAAVIDGGYKNWIRREAASEDDSLDGWNTPPSLD